MCFRRRSHTAGARLAGRPGSLPPSGSLASRPGLTSGGRRSGGSLSIRSSSARRRSERMTSCRSPRPLTRVRRVFSRIPCPDCHGGGEWSDLVGGHSVRDRPPTAGSMLAFPHALLSAPRRRCLALRSSRSPLREGTMIVVGQAAVQCCPFLDHIVRRPS
jgi:hypothetical protein